MDELSALRQMRSKAYPEEVAVKERIWNRLQAEARTLESGRSEKRGLSRWIKGAVAGLILLAALAASPVGPAVADRVGDFLGISEESHRTLKRIDARIEGISHKDFAGLTDKERFEASAARMNSIIEQEVIAGGGSVGPVSIRMHPNPLRDRDLGEYAAFCEKLKRQYPGYYLCDLNLMVQTGELPPGLYKQADIDRLFPELSPNAGR